jgi:hypothetical protein
MLYELLTGSRPFAGTMVMDTLKAVMDARYTAPRVLRPEIPAALDAVRRKCLGKDPSRRYADASALADAPRRFREGWRPGAAAGGFWKRLWRLWRRDGPAPEVP